MVLPVAPHFVVILIAGSLLALMVPCGALQFFINPGTTRCFTESLGAGKKVRVRDHEQYRLLAIESLPQTYYPPCLARPREFIFMPFLGAWRICGHRGAGRHEYRSYYS